MGRASAGLLMYRRAGGGIEVLLVHPGGPFWASRDDGAWSIPKGLVDAGEDALAAARREFTEETGLETPEPLDGGRNPYLALGEVRQKSGKAVRAWAFEGDADPAAVRSNAFMMEWPRGSGRRISVPEVDRAGWFGLSEARRKLNPGQAAFVDALERGAGTWGQERRG